MPVDPRGMPVRRPEALNPVIGDGQAGRTVDRAFVVIKQHDQPTDAEMASRTNRLLAAPLHEVAVAGQAVRVVADDLIAVAAIEQPLGERHADSVTEALAERPSRGLDAGGVAIFRVARSARAELAKALKLIELHPRKAGEMTQRRNQHRAVASGEHEAVAV